MKDMLKKVFKHWEMFLVIFLILEFVVFGAANPKFLRPQSIMNSIVNYISVCIISLFVTMVMITGGIDIQAPAIIGLSSIIIGVLWSDAGLNIWAACGDRRGGRRAVRRALRLLRRLLRRSADGRHPGRQLPVFRHCADGLRHVRDPGVSGHRRLPGEERGGQIRQLPFLGKGNIFGIPTQIVIYVVLILLCMWILHRTKYGERLFLIGVNPQAAEYSGINTRASIMSTYVLSAVSAAIAGTLLTANVNSAKYDLGSGYTLAIITAVVLGGTLNTGGKGSIIGTVLASLIICILRYGLPLCFGVSTQNLDLPIGLILVVVVLRREIAGQHMLSPVQKEERLNVTHFRGAPSSTS